MARYMVIQQSRSLTVHLKCAMVQLVGNPEPPPHGAHQVPVLDQDPPERRLEGEFPPHPSLGRRAVWLRHGLHVHRGGHDPPLSVA